MSNINLVMNIVDDIHRLLAENKELKKRLDNIYDERDMALVENIELKEKLDHQDKFCQEFIYIESGECHPAYVNSKMELKEKLDKAIESIIFLDNLIDNSIHLAGTEIPKDLDPTMYHTLSYIGDVAIRDRYLDIRKTLEDIKESK